MLQEYDNIHYANQSTRPDTIDNTLVGLVFVQLVLVQFNTITNTLAISCTLL